MKITHETIENVSILAKLALDPKEKRQAGQDMERMLDYIKILDEVDTKSVSPLTHIFENRNTMRQDVVTQADGDSDILANAPRTKDGMFQVPRTI